jgi:PAS domain S-box-containing protein
MFAEMHGYTVEELIGKPVLDVYAPEARDELAKHIKIVNEKGHHTFESIHNRKDGTTFPVQMDMTAVYDENGKFMYRVVNCQDITGRKHVEEALRLSEANYRTLIESAADGIFVTDTRGRVLDVNLLSCRLLNYTREEILGLSIPDIVLDEEVARVALELGRLKAGEVVRSEWQFRRKDGTLFPGEVSGTTLPDGRHLGILRDITERKRAEDALRQTKEMMEKIIMTVPGAVSSFHQHTDGSISFPFVSPRFEEFYNISAERLAADASAIFSLIHPDDVGGMQETIAESARTMEPWHYEWRVNNPVLGEIWLEGNSMPIKETDGSIVWHGVVSDITGRKRAEAVLIEKERLISAIAETTPAIIYVYDMVTNSNVYINTGMERLLGYTSKEIHDMGEKVLAILLHPDDLPKIIELSSKILAASDNELFSVEYRMKHRDSNWVNLQSEESVFLRDRNGAVLQKIGVAIDITERKRIEDILKARNTILEFSFHSTLGQLLQKTLDEIEILTESKIAFFHFVEEDQITLSLQTWSTNTLQKMCTAEGKNSHYPIDQAGVWVDCVHSRSAVIHNDYSSLPHKKGLPDGHAPVTRELVVPILRNEKIVAILGVGNKESNYDETDIQTITKVADLVWDITVSKRAEETLRISEERLRLSTELANVAVWEFDFNTNSMSRSKNHDSLYGLEWQSKWEFETFLNATHPVDREYSNQIIQNSAAAGGPDNYKFDFRAVHPDKSIHWLEVTGQVVERNPEGRGVIVRGTLIDITERKKIEEERRDLTYRLIVSEEQMRKIAARHLHDEVGQNLTALSINLNYLQSQLSEESKLRMEKRLADSLSILEETIDQIRNIMIELRPAVLDDYGLNSAFSLSLNKFSENTNLNVVYNGNDLARRLPVNIEFALFRVVQEAVHNISKHAEAKNVWVTLEEKNELVKITVQDDGIGFDINRVTASKVNRGLGLLSMAERIKFIGGNLEISSSPGKGTIITVTIKR